MYIYTYIYILPGTVSGRIWANFTGPSSDNKHRST